MTLQQIINMLSEVREVIAWNEIKNYELSDETRLRACIDIEDAIEQLITDEF